MPIFIAALFATAKTWKQPKCPLIGEWTKKMWYIYIYTHTMEYHSIIKNEIMPFAATQTDLKIIILSQTKKGKYHMVSLTCQI